MSAGPLISVVSASYNALEGLKATARSVAEQTYGDAEHIVVDGGSGDGTVDFLQSLGDRVRWISEPDDGIGDALNKGVAMARGEYVLVLQAEDYFVDAGSLAACARHLGGHDLVSFGVQVESGAQRTYVESRGDGWRSRLHMTMPHQGLFARRQLFDEVGLFDTSYRIAMDYDWLLRARNYGATALAVKEAHTVMPATGISSRTDWPGMEARLLEFRRTQLAHAASSRGRKALRGWWSLYLPFKRLKLAASGR